MSEALRMALRCPACRAELRDVGQGLECVRSGCARAFPVVDGIPVLINEDASVFSKDDFVSLRPTFFDPRHEARKAAWGRLIPRISRNVRARENVARLVEMLLTESTAPRVLVVGGSILGEGMELLVREKAMDIVESDVAWGPRVTLISDAHDIPFEDGTFNAVILQAVLEHVVDPYRCVGEAHRVLKPGGLVYAETPFMQQVHGGQYDFTRFTHLGHRRLFRKFEELSSGAVCGPGMALAWSLQYFALSFATSRTLRTLIKVCAASVFWPLKYVDAFWTDRPGALDAASGLYFLGRRSDRVLSDRDLIAGYVGAV